MVPTPAENRPLAVVPETERAIAPAVEVRLGLSRADAQAATAFSVTGNMETAVEDARGLAEALAGDDGEAARLRLYARCASSCRTRLRDLEILQGKVLAEGDLAGVHAIEKLIDGTARRLAMFLNHMAHEAELRRRPSVAIVANNVSIGARR